MAEHELDQLWYTWSTNGLGSMAMGYRVRAASEGLYDTQSLRYRRVNRFLRYELPQGVNASEFDARNAPISLAFVNNGDENLLIRKVFKGRDLAGRNTVFFTHLIAGLPPEFTARDAISLWTCPGLWTDSEEGKASNDTLLPKLSYKTVLAVARQAQSPFGFAPVQEQLRSILQLILSRGMPAYIYATGQSLLTAALIYGLTHCLPATMLKGLTFSTYESNASESETVIVGTMSSADMLETGSLQIQPPTPTEAVSKDIQSYVTNVVNALVTGNMAKFNSLLADAEKLGCQTTEELIKLYQRRFMFGPLTQDQLLDIISHPADNLDSLLDTDIQQKSAALILQHPNAWEQRNKAVFAQAASWAEPGAQNPLTQQTRETLATYLHAVAWRVIAELQKEIIQFKHHELATIKYCGEVLLTLAPPRYSPIWQEMLTELAQGPIYTRITSDDLWFMHAWLLQCAKHIPQKPNTQVMLPWLRIPSWEKLGKLLKLDLPLEWEQQAIFGRIERDSFPKNALPIIQLHEAKFKDTLQMLILQGNPAMHGIVVRFFYGMVEHGYLERAALLLFLINTPPIDASLIDKLFAVVPFSSPSQLTADEINLVLAECRPEVIAACGSSPALTAYIREYILQLTPGKLSSNRNIAKLLGQLDQANGGAVPALPDALSDLVSHWFVIISFIDQRVINGQAFKDVIKALQYILQSLHKAPGENRSQVFADEFFPILVEKVKSEHDLGTVIDAIEQIAPPILPSPWDCLRWMAMLATKTHTQTLYRLIPYLSYGVQMFSRSKKAPEMLDTYLDVLFGNSDDATLKAMDIIAKNNALNEEVQAVWNDWYEVAKPMKRSMNRFTKGSSPIQKQTTGPIPAQQLHAKYPTTDAARKTAAPAPDVPQFVAILKQHNEGIPYGSYQKIYPLMREILPYWDSVLLEKQQKMSTSRSLRTEEMMIKQLAQELSGKNLVQLLVDDVLIKIEIDQAVRKGVAASEFFNPGKFLNKHLTELQLRIGDIRYQQLRQTDELTTALCILIRRSLFMDHMEASSKDSLQSWLEKERKRARVEYFGV